MGYEGALTGHANGLLSGWCVDTDNPGRPVFLDICWGDQFLRKVRADRPNPAVERAYGSRGSTFYFEVHESFLELLPQGDLLQVLTPSGQPLLPAETLEPQPFGNATDGGAELRSRLDAGCFMDKWGALKLPFRAMPAETRGFHASAMDRTARYFRDRHGITLFPHYGSLLGYARSKSFLPHDDDTDMSFIIEDGDLFRVAQRFLDLAEACHDDGLMIRVVGAGQYSVYLPDNGGIGTEVFCSWHVPDTGHFSTYFGVHGQIDGRIDFFADRMEGAELAVPDRFRDIMALTYGPDWLIPDPNFSWSGQVGALRAVMQELRDAAGVRVEDLARKGLTRGQPEPVAGLVV